MMKEIEKKILFEFSGTHKKKKRKGEGKSKYGSGQWTKAENILEIQQVQFLIAVCAMTMKEWGTRTVTGRKNLDT